jgi:hypothetical protein
MQHSTFWERRLKEINDQLIGMTDAKHSHQPRRRDQSRWGGVKLQHSYYFAPTTTTTAAPAAAAATAITSTTSTSTTTVAAAATTTAAAAAATTTVGAGLD